MNIEQQAKTRLIRRGDSGPVVEAVQQALRNSGAELAPHGNFGPITEAAVRRFQAAHHLDVDGVVGQNTARVLDSILPAPGVAITPPLQSVLAVAPHLATMRAVTGTREVPGFKDSPIILAWSKVIADAFPDLAAYARTYKHDETPWCGHGMAYCFALNKERPPDEYLWALNWRNPPHMVRVPLDKPFVGAIFTGTRAGGGHVSCVEGWTRTHWIIRGCNQSDMVNVVARAKADSDRLSWPASLPIPAQNWRVPITSAGAAGKES